jgi:hypothetical protein
MTFFNRRDRAGRRRDDDGADSIVFDAVSVQFVQASDDLGLLRVIGYWVAPVSVALGDVVLLAIRGPETVEVQPLPDLSGAAPLASPAGEDWRGAFTMPVELATDPRLELVLVAGEDAAVALPRPGELAAAPVEDPEADGEPSPIVAELVAQLDEVARLEEHEADEDFAEPLEDGLVVDPALDHELLELRAELELRRAELESLQAELDSERGRREALEQELRARDSVEDDLRNAMATQEAQLASAVAEASQRVRQEERRRDLVPPPSNGAERPDTPPADEEFLSRLERARRAAELAGPA